MRGSRATVLALALIASFAGGDSAAANWSSDPASQTEIATDTAITPHMGLPNGCGGDDWSSEGSID